MTENLVPQVRDETPREAEARKFLDGLFPLPSKEELEERLRNAPQTYSAEFAQTYVNNALAILEEDEIVDPADFDTATLQQEAS